MFISYLSIHCSLPCVILAGQIKGVPEGFRKKAHCCLLIKVSKKTSWLRLETEVRLFQHNSFYPEGVEDKVSHICGSE